MEGCRVGKGVIFFCLLVLYSGYHRAKQNMVESCF